jgi:ABC-type glycerol-3-phosphate transport system substrate-binding protein
MAECSAGNCPNTGRDFIMKYTAVFVALVALMFAVGFAGADVSIPDALPMGLTIDYWHEWDGAQADAMTQIIDDFNGSNEWGITVEQVYQGNTGGLIDQLSTGIVSGELPNLSGAVFTN